ncbi:MAG: hypothetical protein LUF89_07390 [Ruminococcus sp.]|nr:hypothetical protein [Ruminococcus sp.]
MALTPLDPDTIECNWLADNGICELMKSCRCRGTDYTFRRTAAQTQQANIVWRSRMASLPEEQQYKIAKKYYGGNMPWK